MRMLWIWIVLLLSVVSSHCVWAQADFSVAVAPQSIALTAGQTQVFTVTAIPAGGFSSTVTASLSALPSGVTSSASSYSLTPGIPVRVTLTATSGVTSAVSAITATGISGALSHTSQLELTVGTPADYSVAASMGSVNLLPGGSQAITVTTTALNGFSGTVSGSIAGLPSGCSASPSTFSLSAGSSQTITLSATGSAATGIGSAVIQTTSGSLVHNTPVVVHVGSAMPDFTLQVPAAVSVSPGSTVTIPVSALGANGFIDSVVAKVSGLPGGVSSSPSSNTLLLTPVFHGPHSFTLTASSSLSSTPATSVIHIQGTSGSLSHTSDIVLTTAPNSTVAATVDPNSPGSAFPPYFLGYSFPTQTQQMMTGSGSTTNPIFASLLLNFKNYVGVPNLRIGIPTSSTIRSEIAALQSALTVGSATGPTVPQFFFTVPSPYNASQTAGFVQSLVSSIGSTNLLGIEIDNEPDLFYSNKDRAPTWTFANYLTESSGYQQAFAPYLTAPALIGMATSSTYWDVDVPAFLTQEAGQISTYTAHEYPLSNCATSSTTPTVALLLSDPTAHIFYGRYAPLAASTGSVSTRVGEMNSVACSGLAGVSDTFAASLWVADALFEAKSAGVSGVNFHTDGLPTGAFAYDAFYVNGSTVQVFAPYYGLMLFAQAIQNEAQPLPVTVTQVSGNVKIWATLDQSNVARILVLEKDTDGSSNTHSISINMGSAGTVAGSLTTMTAPSISSTSGISIGGLTFDGTTTGLPSGTATSTPATPSSGVYTFSVADGSAALLTIQL